MLKKRFDQLQEALGKVKAGLTQANHPHILSPLRMNVRNKPPKQLGESKSQTIEKLVKIGSFACVGYHLVMILNYTGGFSLLLKNLFWSFDQFHYFSS